MPNGDIVFQLLLMVKRYLPFHLLPDLCFTGINAKNSISLKFIK